MTSILQQIYNPFFSSEKSSKSLANSDIRRHDEAGKQEALDAIDILIEYKTNVQQFTDEIVAHWSIPRKIMERYEIDDVDQLNEWLDNLS